MEAVLLFVAVFILVFNFDVDDLGRASATTTNPLSIADHARSAEEAIEALTDETILAMVQETRAWQPGDGR